MSKKLVLFFILINVFIQHGSPNFETHAAQKPCISCHPKVGKGKHVHPALKMGCDKCHVTSGGKEHPKHAESIKLSLAMPGLCYKCHREANFTGSYVHSPVAKGNCSICHDPHRSDVQEPLRKEPQDICFGCHAEVEFTRKYIHPVALAGCGKRCHNPHASDYPHLLQSDVVTLCIGCHKKEQSGTHIVTLPGGKIHPVGGVRFPNNRNRFMDCASCHNPHSSNYSKLFTSNKKCHVCHRYY